MNASRNRRPVGVILVALALALAVAAVPAALAAKGGNGTNSGHGGNGGGNSGSGGSGGATTSSLALRMVTDLNGDGGPNWGDTVTFDVSTTATNSYQVSLDCYQNGGLVYHANAAWYDGNPYSYMQYMRLASGAWTGGAADCTAVAYYLNGNKTVTLATLGFGVAA